MAELQRLARICKFKNWDLFMEHEECSRAQRRTVFIGDVMVRDRSTNEILLKAHDVNSSKRQLLRTCCEKLMCRLEMRQAEKEMKSHTENQKKKAQMYLDEAYDDPPPSPKTTTHRLTMKSLSTLESGREITLDKVTDADLRSESLDDGTDAPPLTPPPKAASAPSAVGAKQRSPMKPKEYDGKRPRSLRRSDSDHRHVARSRSSSSRSNSSASMSPAEEAPPAMVHPEELPGGHGAKKIDKSLEEEFKQLPTQAKKHLRAILARRESATKLAASQCT